jgi:hypothetical protein
LAETKLLAPASLMPRRPWRLFITGSTAVIALVAGLELALRLILGLGNPILIARDIACDYITKPNQDIYRFFVHTYINRFGMRSDEIPTTKAPNTLRIYFAGDSITYGTTHVDQAAIFSELVRRELPTLVHKPVDVLNGSANAWAPANEAAFLESRGLFQSDVVILVLNDGDLTQPIATIAEVGDGLPEIRPSSAIGEVYTRYIKPRLLHENAKSDAGISAAEHAESTIQSNFFILDKLQAYVMSQGSHLAIAFLPFRASVSDGATRSAPQHLLKWCKAQGVPLVDLAFAISTQPLNSITIYDRVHLNALGNGLVATGLEERWNQIDPVSLPAATR